MNKQIFWRLFFLLALVVGLGGVGAAVVTLSATGSAVAAQGLGRDKDPVVISGTVISALVGFPVDELFAYVYRDGHWTQIPAQIDEVTATGSYTSTEDGLFDFNDEIVFMAADLGDQAPLGVPITASLPVSNGWYQIEVTDPQSPTQTGWAYLVHSTVLTPSAAADYVDYIPGLHRIYGVDYRMGFGAAHIGVDWLMLGDSTIEILDRTKIRVDCTIPILCPLTDGTLPPVPDDVITDGPVRVIARGGQVLAYGSMLRWASPFSFPTLPSVTLRLSTDFNPAASGAIYYNAVVTEGVTVDGITDTVPATPRSPWWQLSTVSGTLIHIADTTSIGGTQSNYYVDDSAWDESDTGDRRHYGDTGVSIENPSFPFTYTVTIYFLRGSQPNVGATYEALYTHPLSVTAVLYGDPRPDYCDWSGQDYDDFYVPPDLGQLTPERLGELLRVEHIDTYTPAEVADAAGLPSSRYGAEAYRVLYLSQTPISVPRSVSGFIIVPIGPTPEGGFPVIAHGHGTTGLADDCALSKYALNVRALLPWVAGGYLVSATDYVGLGTPGLHPYAVGESEALSMLDGARAALGFCDNAYGIVKPRAANRIILEGHSQGGHAALFGHQLWESYAPELDLVGTVAFAPGSESRLLTQHVAKGSSALVTPAAMIIYSYSEYYPEPLDLQVFLKEPYATEIGIRAEEQCLLGLTLWIGFDVEQVFQSEMITATKAGRWDDLEPLTTYLDANTPGNFDSDVPALVIQGEDDPYIPPEISVELARRMCRHGTPVTLSRYEGVGHTTISSIGRPEALQWMADRLAGIPVLDSCSGLGYDVFLPVVLR
jgi:pimeloyl-ACP methyl ester carboxylesterase